MERVGELAPEMVAALAKQGLVIDRAAFRPYNMDYPHDGGDYVYVIAGPEYKTMTKGELLTLFLEFPLPEDK